MMMMPLNVISSSFFQLLQESNYFPCYSKQNKTLKKKEKEKTLTLINSF